jgi:hypothetical protein
MATNGIILCQIIWEDDSFLWTWKCTVVIKPKALSRHLPAATEKNHENLSLYIRCAGQDSNPEHSEQMSQMLPPYPAFIWYDGIKILVQGVEPRTWNMIWKASVIIIRGETSKRILASVKKKFFSSVIVLTVHSRKGTSIVILRIKRRVVPVL